MAFNPLKNYQTPIESTPKPQNKTLMDSFVAATNQKNLAEEVNHKSNIYKILKLNTNLTKDECIALTKSIDEYYSKHM